MIAIIKKYKRGILLLVLLLVFFMGGMIMMSLDLEITGSLFLISAVLTIIYLLSTWLLKWKKGKAFMFYSPKKELGMAMIILTLISISGVIEPFHSEPELSLVYVVLLCLVAISGYFKFRDESLKFPYWLIVVGIGVILMSLNDYADEDEFEIIVTAYFSVIFFLFLRWIFRQIQMIVRLKNEQTKTELLHLKSQVNPHFFFNTLNNLYGWVGKDTKVAQELILNLSDMMRYSIYEGQKEVVTLEEEIAYLKNYIELHRIRYHKKIDIQFDIQIEQEGEPIMPLLFIILLENAFKHGVENLRENAYVDIHLIADLTKIEFTVSNNFDPSEATDQAGIGLKNLQRRLELVYPDKHALFFDQTENVYTANLIIQK